MFISVIIPVYNRARQLIQAIQSVRSQTFKEYELIIMDDGSTDETAGMEIPGSRIIRHQTQCGVSAARNDGVNEARGEWIAFLDSDDIWHPSKLAEQVEWIDKNPGYRIVQCREIWIRHGKRVNPPQTHEKKQGDLFAESLKRCMITPSSVMLQKTLFLETGGFNEALPACEDYDLWLRITARYPVGLVDRYLLTRYGGHDDQLSSCTPMLDRFRIRSLLDLLGSGTLHGPRQTLVKSALKEKALILANGNRKRGNDEQYEHYRTIAENAG